MYKANKVFNGNRIYSIDLTKSIAIFFVIVIHLSSWVFAAEVGELDLIFGIFWESAARAAVPLFFMSSGVLLLDKRGDIPIKKVYGRYMWRIIKALLLWSLLYKIYHITADGTVTLSEIKNTIKELFLFDHEFHMYYLHIMLIIYIFLPVIKKITDNSSEKLLKYIIGVWFIFAIVYPTFKEVYPLNIIKGIPLQWLINMTYGSMGYMVLGYYIKKFPIKSKTAAALTILGFLVIFGGTYAISRQKGELYGGLLEGMSLGVCLYSAGLFSLLQKADKRPEGFLSKVPAYISKASFFIYLSHVFLIYEMAKYKIDLYILPLPLSVPIISACILLICMALYYIFGSMIFVIHLRCVLITDGFIRSL